MHDDYGRTIRPLTFTCLFGAGLLLAPLFLHPVEAKSSASSAASKRTRSHAAVSPPMPNEARPAVDPARAALERRDFARAKMLAEEAAARGEPSANSLLGQLYEQGLGVRRDYGKAVEWYAKGAALGDAQSQFSLGMLLVTGRGVAKNKKRAAQFFELAAAKNYSYAEYNLALLYAEGVVYPQDYAKVAMWLKKAAAQNHVQAQYDLGGMYRAGIGTPKDEAKGEYWIGLAAKAGHPDAELDYAIILFHRALPPPPKPGDKVDLRKVKLGATGRAMVSEGIQFLRLSAQKGNPVAQNRLAKAYIDGFLGVVERDPVLAAKWHLIARAAGATDGRLDLFLTTLTPDQRRRADVAVQKWRAAAGLPAAPSIH
jgi:TPR repeat protein